MAPSQLEEAFPPLPVQSAAPKPSFSWHQCPSPPPPSLSEKLQPPTASRLQMLRSECSQKTQGQLMPKPGPPCPGSEVSVFCHQAALTLVPTRTQTARGKVLPLEYKATCFWHSLGGTLGARGLCIVFLLTLPCRFPLSTRTPRGSLFLNLYHVTLWNGHCVLLHSRWTPRWDPPV